MKKILTSFIFMLFIFNCTIVSYATVYMGAWATDNVGTWYRYNDGTYPTCSFFIKEGKLYYTNQDGYLLPNTQLFNGYQTDSDGAIMGHSLNNDMYSSIYNSDGWRQDENGWWYQYADGSYPKNTDLKVNGKWYWVGTDGYMLRNCYAKDSAYYGDDGARVNKTNNIPKYKVYMNTKTNPNAKYIVMEYKNNSDNDVIIYSEFAKLYNHDYSNLNRDLKLVEAGSTSVINLDSITISPGERKMLSFAVEGNSTYYDKKTIISFILMTNNQAYHCMSSADGSSEMVRSETFDNLNSEIE